MKKKLTICGKEYEICTNAFCMFEYKKQFKTGIIADIGKMQDYNIKITKVEEDNKGKSREEIELLKNRAMMEEIDTIIQVPLQLAYIFIKCANKNFMDFEEWTESIEEIKLDDDWIVEVTELAVNSFCGQRASGTIQTSKEQE